MLPGLDTDPLEYLIDCVFRELPEGAELKYIDAQKIFYLTQRRLDPDNRVAESLPFYWYQHGPMSTAVSHTLQSAKAGGVVDGRTTETGGQVFTPGGEDPPGIAEDEDLAAAEAAIREVLEQYDVFGNLDERLREDIYVDAPYDFQLYYKFEVLPAVEAFARDPYYLAEPPEEIQFRLARAEGKTPTDAAFDEWRKRFSWFVTLAETYLAAVDESEKRMSETFGRLATDVWELFAKRLRIEEHDEAYADKEAAWELEYENSQQSVDDSLQRFEATLDEQFGPYDTDDETNENSIRVAEDSAWGRVNRSLLEGESDE
ncbi:hypothetical protein [Halobaculum sp. MBLA0143]|uniref:hypothetical protein n=1 Tax=Halobaculum sp. MBLA0143 TaxID=3079933 RepID=UPI0035231BA4